MRPSSVMLVFEASDENQAREIAFNYKGIGSKFCTSYEYNEVKDEFLNQYGMQEYSLEDLENLRIK